MTENQAMGLRIKESRVASGLTQKELGEKISKTESSIAKYEKGVVEIPLSTITKLSKVLHVSRDYLMGNVNDPLFHLNDERILAEINSYADEINTNKMPDLLTAIRRSAKNLTDDDVNDLIVLVEAKATRNSKANKGKKDGKHNPPNE